MTFKFECNYEDTNVVFAFSSESLLDVTEQFEYFLKGCGFQLGNLQIIEKED